MSTKTAWTIRRKRELGEPHWQLHRQAPLRNYRGKRTILAGETKLRRTHKESLHRKRAYLPKRRKGTNWALGERKGAPSRWRVQQTGSDGRRLQRARETCGYRTPARLRPRVFGCSTSCNDRDAVGAGWVGTTATKRLE